MARLRRAAFPLLRLLPPEMAQRMILRQVAGNKLPAAPQPDPILKLKLWDLSFPTPIGLAAGFDRDALAPDAFLRLGFGFVEIGSVTPAAQRGNPRPRLFRLALDGALINRMGGVSSGLELVASRLEARRQKGGIVGVNIARSRDATDADADCERCVRRLAPLADYLVINLAAATPGPRQLQRRNDITALVRRLKTARGEAVPQRPPPLLVKISPDLTEEERSELAEMTLSSGVDGLVIGDAMVARPPGLRGSNAHQPGGLSGKPLFAPSTALVADMYRRTRGRVPLIGVGGIVTGADAYAKIRAGASLVQLYTALTFHGPELVGRITQDLAARLRRDGFTSLAGAIGA